jgi:hypothetical protein
MKKIVNKLIDESVKGVDTYTHNGSTWLIFTESKQWVIELTESKTLWYNYNFFKGMFDYVSMDVVDNQHYITQWVEDNIVNVVKDTILEQNITEGEVEGIIEMAVKENSFSFVRMKVDSYNVIKNGVKETNKSLRIDGSLVIEDTIQNGVIETNHVDVMKFFDNKMDDVIENGVKDTQLHKGIRPSAVEHTIENGVKKTGPIQHKYMVEDIIENGVRHTLNTEYMPKTMVEDIIENGVKETKTPSNGDIVSFAEWMKENNSTSYPKLIDDVIDNGVKEIRPSGCVDPKTGIFHYRIQEQVDDVVDNGIINTKSMDGWVNTPRIVGEVIDNGIKKVQPLPDQSGELIGYSNYYRSKENRTKPFIDYLEETIKFGVKENLG